MLSRYLYRMELQEFKNRVMPLREKLVRFAQRMLASNEDAEDAIQEVYIRLWNVRQQLIDHPNIDGFAMQTTKNICIDRLRKERYNVSIDDINNLDENPNPYLYTEQMDSADIVKSIIATLPELQRKTLTMRDIEGYELSEIAEITGVQITTVTVNLSRARKKVRDIFLSKYSIK